MKQRSGWRTTINGWRPSALLRSLDLALIDPPLLCCDDDELCPACRMDGGCLHG
ncbi:MAG: hypothetical protein JWM34_1046 [Ilumatobacteraceae bacterium]|nr:hypothetical protein [Ilumatobacteraceae bacterium]